MNNCGAPIIFLSRTSFINYARWQLLLSEFLVATASLESSWTTMHERRFPQSSKLSQSASFACVELAEAAMPLAVARPFVDELINKSTTIKVIVRAETNAKIRGYLIVLVVFVEKSLKTNTRFKIQ